MYGNRTLTMADIAQIISDLCTVTSAGML